MRLLLALPTSLLATAAGLWLANHTLAASLLAGVTGDITLVLALVWLANRPGPAPRSLPRTNPAPTTTKESL